MTVHWVVIAAAALTTLLAAAAGAALAAFAGQALPQAVRHDLVAAPGTALIASGSFSGSDVTTTTDALRSAIGSALPGVPFGFWQGIWSDPLGLVPGALPAQPTGDRGNTPLLEAASLDGIQAHSVLVSGVWPWQDSAPAGGIPAALPATAAALLKLRTGDVLRLRDRTSNAPVTFEITGLYAQQQLSGPAAAYWQLNSVPASGSATAGGFTTYGPLVVAPQVFPSQLAATSVTPGHLAAATGTWVAQPDMTRFTDAILSTTSARVSALSSALSSSSALNSVQLSTSLTAVLSDAGSNLAVARSLLAISALQLTLLVLAALIAVARLLSTQRESETALLTARGATRWQLARLTAAEVIPLLVITALLGGAAGVWLARVLGSSLGGGSGSGYGGVSVRAAGTWLDAMAAAAVIAVLAIGTMLFPVLRQPAATASSARQTAISGATRAGADLALIALAVLAGWQLRRYSAVTASANGGAPSIDPVLVLAPALALAGGTVLTLRLLPAGARAAERLAAMGRGLTGALAGWQFSRQPLRQGGAALLLVMAVATGALVLAQHASWSRSAADQAAFAVGSDVRVDLAAPLPVGTGTQVSGVPGVRSAMAVAATVQSLPAEVVAIDSAKARQVVRLRPDESALPASRLFAAIAPAAGTGGMLIQGRPRTVSLTATLSRARLGTVTAMFTVTDADGASFQLPARAPLPADGRPHVLSVSFGGTKAAYPLRLTQVTLSYTVPGQHLTAPVKLTIGGATASDWIAAVSSAEIAQDSTYPGQIKFAAPQAIGWQAVPGGATLTFAPGFGVAYAGSTGDLVSTPADGQLTLTAAGAVPKSVPAIVTRAFLNRNNTGLGAIVPANVNGAPVPVRIAAVVSTFPTVTGSAIIVDLPTIQAFLASNGAAPLPVTQWWLATDGAQVLPSLAKALPPGTAVTSMVALSAANLADPLSAAPQQALLALAVAAVLLAITGFWVSIAADVSRRRTQNALLAALGVTRRSAAARLFLEKLLLSVPAAALGLVLGTVVAGLLVPAVTLTATAQTPVPPPDILFDLSQTAPLAAAVAVLPALAAALVVFRRPDPAAELRAAEADSGPGARYLLRPIPDGTARGGRGRASRAGRRPRRLPRAGPGGRTARGGVGGSGPPGRTAEPAARPIGGKHSRVRWRTPRSVNVWLALLTFCLVFTATAGVREALASRTAALHQTLGAFPVQASAITVAGSWQSISAVLPSRPATAGYLAPSLLSEQQTSEITSELRGDLNRGVVPLAPATADWAALTTELNPLTPTPPTTDGTPVDFEIAYRQPLARHVRLISGAFPKAPLPAPASDKLPPGVSFYPVLQVVVTKQTADQFDLRPGATLKVPGPLLPLIGKAPPITLVVSGIVAPTDPSSAFWTSDPTIATPDLVQPLEKAPFWLGEAIATPGESAAVQADFGSVGISVQWSFPLAVSDLTGQQAQPLSDALTGLSSKALPLSGDVAPVSNEITASTGLVADLAPFLSAAQSADALLWLLYVSLTVVGLVALLLACRMVVLHSSTELALIRARGASSWQLGGAVGGAAALVCVPASVVAVVLAALAVPGAGSPQSAGAVGAWWPVLSVLLVAVCGTALMAGWRNRLHSAGSGRRATSSRGRRQRGAWVRMVAELSLIVAAVGGIIVFRKQGLQTGAGVDLYSSAAPALIAIPAVVVVFRLYPLVLRWLLHAAARMSGAPAFLGLARAARTGLTPALPAFGLALALTVAAFGGMVRDAVTNAQVAASWQTVGADVTIMPSQVAPGFTIPAATARAIAAVPGVTHAAGVYKTTWSTPDGTQVTGLAVDPAGYAALVAATEGYPAVPTAPIATVAQPGTPQPVLASPSAAAALGKGTVVLSTQDPVRPVTVRVAGTLSSTPALSGMPGLPANPSFVIMPIAALQSSATPLVPVPVNEMLLTGPGIDRARLTAVLRSLAGGDTTFRSDVLAGLTGAPLQHGAATVITLSTIAAAVLGLVIMLLELALGAAERDATLARLATMGLGEGQRARVVAVELLPALIAAALAAWACALVLPPVLRPVIDLSVFTESSAPVPLVPNVAAVAVPLTGLLVLAATSVGIEIRAGRRRGAASLRIGE